MGLFDKIKKAFTADVKEEPQIQEPEVQDDQLTPDETTTETDAVIDSEKTVEASSAETVVETEPEEVIEETVMIEKPVEIVEETPEVSQPETATETSEIEVPAEDAATSEAVTEVVDAELLPADDEEPEVITITTKPTDSTEPAESIPAAPEPTEEVPLVELEIEEPVEESVDQAAVETETTVHQKYDQGLAKTRKSFGEKMNELFARFRRVDEEFFEELEETLIGADVGFETAINLTESLRNEVKLKNAKKTAQVQNVIVEKLVEIYEQGGMDENTALNIQPNGLTVILFVGVNGTGKTTSIGKLAHQYQMEGKKVLLAAADTFRAGAIDQLVVWGERSGVEVVRGNAGGDPAAVVYDAVEKAKNGDYDILLVDTAGRLQNKVNLMNELAKINRIIQREIPEAPHEVLLVVDATTGQNALVQARQFKEATDVTGIVLTKLDGTAKGGIVLAIRNELHLPVKLVGLGEGIDDLEPFDSNEFAIGLFKGLLKEE